MRTNPRLEVLGQAIVVRLAVSVYRKLPLIGPSTRKQLIKFEFKPRGYI